MTDQQIQAQLNELLARDAGTQLEQMKAGIAAAMGLAVVSLTRDTFLRSLSLHGNPVEDHKHYRNFVITMVPSLIQLDFSPVTKQDRSNAATWAQIFRKKLARARGEDVEEGVF